jgi:preprotein translocase subunit Sec61beta
MYQEDKIASIFELTAIKIDPRLVIFIRNKI